MKVYVAQIEAEDGTRVKFRGRDVDAESAQFEAAADIEALKTWIVDHYIGEDFQKRKIIVFTPPTLAGGDGNWIRAKVDDKLMEGQMYGFMDLHAKVSRTMLALLAPLDRIPICLALLSLVLTHPSVAVKSRF